MTTAIKSKRGGPFAEALYNFVLFMQGYKQLAEKALIEEGRSTEIPIVEALGSALVEQTIQVNNTFLSVYDDESSSRAADELDEYTKLTALNHIAGSAAGVVDPKKLAKSKGLLSGLFPGLADILEPIKKTLELIMHKLPKIFGGELGEIITVVLDIINNLFGNKQRALSDEAGSRAGQARTEMYNHLQDIYKRDKAKLELKKAREDLED